MELTPALDPISWREEYRELFKSNSVNDAHDYVQRYGNEPLDTDQKLRNVVEKMGSNLHGFERIYPADDQDLALVFINPGLNWREDQRHLDDNYQLSKSDPTNYTRQCSISMDGGFKYLTSHNKDHQAFSRLRKILRQIGEETSTMSDLSATLDRPVDFFGDVYYTNWFKYATHGVGNIEEEIKSQDSFVSKSLRRELIEVDPKLVVILGKQPWVYGLQPYSTSLTGAPDDASISEAQNHLFKCELQGSSFHVFPFNHPSDRNRSRAVGLKSDPFEESLKLFKSESG